MSEFEIEDNMPIPALSGNGKLQRKYPLHEMDVGQSFLCRLKVTVGNT